MGILLEHFQHIKRLQIKALHRVNDLFAGVYRSAFKGRGIEFEDVREYHPGDDIRTIDWNLTARLQRPFVKNFREERELTVMLVVDISASLHFSHIRQLKSELIAELAATLAFSAIKNQDKVGLLLFTDEVELYLKPKKGVRHVLRVMREILYFKPKQRGTDLSKALSFLGLVQKKKTICFVISDFLCPDFQLEANLAAKRHELIAFHVFDVFENHFSPRALFSFYDLETEEEKVIDTADEEVIEHFDQRTKEYQKSVQNLFERAGASYISMHTGESSSSILKRFFRLRKRVIAFPENNALFELAR